MIEKDPILAAIDCLSEMKPEPGQQKLALIEAMTALGRLAKAYGHSFAEGYVAAFVLNLSKERK